MTHAEQLTHRRRNPLPVARLQTVDHAQHLARVAARAGRVHHRQADLLARINDEHRANGESNALLVDIVEVLLVDHVVRKSDFAVRVGDDGELQLRLRELVDVGDPAVVRVEVCLLYTSDAADE